VLLTSHNVLDVMEADADEIAARMAEAVLREVPDHGAVRDPRFAAEVREHSHGHVRAFVAAARAGRPPSGAELEFVRERGAQRARELLPLAAVLHSYLLGQRLMWEAVVERAGGDERAALALTAATFDYAAAVNAAVAEGWTSAASEVAVEDERARRDVLDRLLAGDVAVARRAAALGADLAEEHVVVVASAAGGDVRRVADALGRAAGAHGQPAFVVARHEEVVALLPTRSIPAHEVVGRAEASLARFADVSLRAGVSAPCPAAADVPRAYAEARRALRHASAARSLVRLGDVELAAELALSADDVARATVPEEARALAAHPDLRETLLAFADHDLNVARTAAALHLHPNTIQYRLRRIEQLTGADPRRFHTTLAIVLGLRTLSAVRNA
jgi:PucR C-terminal helix-turn-helix domain/GGDEF-like domain